MAEGGVSDCSAESSISTNTQLENQKSELKELLKKPLKLEDKWYLLEFNWFKQWKKYVGYGSWDAFVVGQNEAYPGPVDNSPLVEEESGKLKEHLIDGLDYKLLYEEAWNKIVSWYSMQEGQTPIERKVIEQGMFVKHCKVEVYLLELMMCENSNLEKIINKSMSRADTIEDLEREMKKTFEISDDKEVRLWYKYMGNTYEHLSKKESTLQDAALYSGQIIVVEQKNEDGTWTREAKSIRYCRVSKQENVSTIYINQEMNVGQIKKEVAKHIGLAWHLIDIVSLEYGSVYADNDNVDTRKTIQIMTHTDDRYVPMGMRTTLPDITYSGMDEPRVLMNCGHAITAENLYMNACVQLKDSKHEIKCFMCNKTWSFDEVAQKSQMAVDEKIFWGARITLNVIRNDESLTECPKCHSYCQQVDKSTKGVRCIMCQKNGTMFDFCWKCKQNWDPNHQCFSKEDLQSMLNSCRKKTMEYSNIPNVPSIRLCPKCGALVEHAELCKQTPCYRCKESFCFVCLTMCVNNHLRCTGYSSKCVVAPVQTVL